MLNGYLGAGLALAFGLLGLSAGAWHVQQVRRLLRSGIRVPAVVVAVADPTDAAIPSVEFVDADGEIQRVELTFGEGSATVGTTIPVIYLPGQPETACPVSSYGLWFVPVGCIVAGIVGLWAAARLALGV